MALSVFPELMDKIDPQDPDSSLRTIENYINYMVERVEFSLTNTFRTTTSLGSSAEAVALVLEDTVNKLSEASSQLAILEGVVNDLLHDIRDYETLDNKPQIASVELVGNKSLAQLGIASQADQTTLEGRVSALETTGGEPNVIETVKRNGTALPVTNKAVDVSVPTKVSDLTNDSGYQTAQQVNAAVAAGLVPLLVAETYGPAPIVIFDGGHGGMPIKSVQVATGADVNSVSVFRARKNLFDSSVFLRATGWTKDADGVYSGANNSFYQTFKWDAGGIMKITPGVRMTISFEAKGSYNGNNIYIGFRYSDGTNDFIAVNTAAYTSYSKTSASGKAVIGITGSYSNNGTTYIKNVQLEVGTSKTGYEAYMGGEWTYDPDTGGLTPLAMSSLAGTNYIWSDGGDVTVEYGAFLAALQAEVEALQ